MTPRPMHDSSRYLAANKFLETLKRHDGEITRQEYKTLRGQALAGDSDGANKGLNNSLYGRMAGRAAP